MVRESKTCAAVAVCGTRSLLRQTTRSPRRTVRAAGLNCMPSITTVCSRASAARAGPPVPRAAVAMKAPASAVAIRIPSMAVRSAGLLAERRLDVLGVLEVGDERRPRYLEQRLQLGVLRIRDQRLVERVDHGLVVRDLVVDVSAVELSAQQLLQVGEVLVAALLQALAGVALLRRDLQLLRSFDGRFVDRRVVLAHQLGERLHVIGVCLGFA